MNALENKVNTLQDLLPEIIKSIEEADREQHLFFDPLPEVPLQRTMPTQAATLLRWKAMQNGH